MGLFDRKKKEVIPDVGSQQPVYAHSGSRAPSIQSAAPSYRTAPAYVPPSQGGGGYGQQSHWVPPNQNQQGYGQQQQQYGQQQPPAPPPLEQKPSRSRLFGGKSKNDEATRNELLAGAPQNAPPGGYLNKPDPYARGPSTGYGQHGQSGQQGRGGGGGGDQYGQGGEEQQAQELNSEDEETEGIKQQMRFVKQESLASTRNALRIAREAEETGRATLDKLGDQSDRIANTERHLDLAKAHNERAIDETKELEALNKSIFRPNMTWNKAAKRDKEEARLLQRHQNEQAEREQIRRDQYESRTRMEQTYKGMDREAENAAAARQRARARGSERQKYQFEADEDDDRVEDEIDDNLDQLGDVAKRLKMLAMASGAEVDAQNAKLAGLSGKVDRLDTKIHQSTARMARIN